MKIRIDSSPESLTEQTIQTSAQNCFGVMLSTLNTIKTQIWANPNGLTPQQSANVVDATPGNLSAAKLFQIAPLMAQILAIVGKDVGQIRPDDQNVIISGDGSSVTITPKA